MNPLTLFFMVYKCSACSALKTFARRETIKCAGLKLPWEASKRAQPRTCGSMGGWSPSSCTSLFLTLSQLIFSPSAVAAIMSPLRTGPTQRISSGLTSSGLGLVHSPLDQFSKGNFLFHQNRLSKELIKICSFNYVVSTELTVSTESLFTPNMYSDFCKLFKLLYILFTYEPIESSSQFS